MKNNFVIKITLLLSLLSLSISLTSAKADPRHEAAKKIQRVFRQWKIKTAALLLKPELSNALKKMKEDDGVVDDSIYEDLIDTNLSDIEFLIAFRKLIKTKDAEGRANFSQEQQQLFEDALVHRFGLVNDGMQEPDFSDQPYHTDIVGFAHELTYYRKKFSALQPYSLMAIFRNDSTWIGVEPTKKNSNKKIFYVGDINDGNLDENRYFHLILLYVDYAKKIAYFFDSLGSHPANPTTDSVDDLYEKLPDFKIFGCQVSIQHDSVNCLTFVMEAMRIIAEHNSFAERLETFPEGQIFLNIPPEFITLTQSLSIIRTYDTWFDFIRKNRDRLDLTMAFDLAFIDPLRKKIEAARAAGIDPLNLKFTIDRAEEFKDEWLDRIKADPALMAQEPFEDQIRRDHGLAYRLPKQTISVAFDPRAKRPRPSRCERVFVVDKLRLAMFHRMGMERCRLTTRSRLRSVESCARAAGAVACAAGAGTRAAGARIDDEATQTRRLQEIARQELNEFAAARGLFNPMNDSTCLFSALAHALRRIRINPRTTRPYTAYELYELAMNYLSTHHPKGASYVAHHPWNHAWGGAPEIDALVQILGIQVIELDQNLQPINGGLLAEPTGPHLIRLVHHSGYGHYLTFLE